MSSRHRVIWSQGMFLQPHHFQQEARYFESVLDARVLATGPHAWGFSQLVIDEAQLALGRLALLRAQGVLPDGTPFAMSDHGLDALPPAFAVPSDLQGELVCLAAPVARTGVTETDFGDGAANAGDGVSRYKVVDLELRDHTNAGDDPEPIQTGAVAFRLMRQRDLTDAFASLGVVRVIEKRADGQLVLDRAYIPPQTRIEASGQLSATAGLLHGLVQQKARELAAAMGQGGNGVSEVGQFLNLLVLNRHEPVLRQFAAAPSVHPWTFHLWAIQLAGELASFGPGQRTPPEFPVYRHDDLQRVFAPVVLELREQLSAVIERHATPIPLTERAHGFRTASVSDLEMMRSAGFVLAVRTQLPAEQVRQRFPAQTKFGPVEKIRDIVQLQLPGVAMRNLPVAPRQLPYHAGSHYFELERQGELWKQLERTGNLALHVGGEFPGLELELWAVRQS